MAEIATVDLPLEVDSALQHATTTNGGNTFKSPEIVENILLAGERTYQTHNKDAQYWLPNDSSEQDRLDFQHETAKMILDNRPGLAPLDSPKDILDIATGTGIWAHEIATQFPEARVLGTDLSKVDRQWPESNLSFVQHDAEKDEWNFGREFDYVHLRFVVSCFGDTKTVFQKAYDNMKPGGYIELFDIEAVHKYMDGPASEAMDKWLDIALGAIARIGGDLTKSAKYKTWLEEVGFVNVVDRLFKSPCNTWPKHPKLKELGARQLVSLVAAAESIDNLVARAGIDAKVINDLRPKSNADMANTDYHAWMPIHIIYARKPLDG